MAILKRQPHQQSDSIVPSTAKMRNIVNFERTVDNKSRIVVTRTTDTTNNVNENFIPWNVSSLEEFLFYFCPECDVRIHSKEKFVNHALNQHPKNIKSHNAELCESCGQSFFNKTSMEMHVFTVHSDEKNNDAFVELFQTSNNDFGESPMLLLSKESKKEDEIRAITQENEQLKKEIKAKNQKIEIMNNALPPSEINFISKVENLNLKKDIHVDDDVTGLVEFIDDGSKFLDPESGTFEIKKESPDTHHYEVEYLNSSSRRNESIKTLVSNSIARSPSSDFQIEDEINTKVKDPLEVAVHPNNIVNSSRQVKVQATNEIHEDASKCNFCDKCFSSEAPLSKHISNFHEGNYSCKYNNLGYKCSYSFKNSVLLEAHIFKEHESNHWQSTNTNVEKINIFKKLKKPVTEKVIEIGSNTSITLEKPKMKTNSNNNGVVKKRLWEAEKEAMEIAENKRMKNSTTNDSEVVQIIEVGKTKTNNVMLSMATNIGGKLQCGNCSKVFLKKTILRHHLYKFHVQPMYKKLQKICNNCQKKFLSEITLKKHLNKQCELCDKSFKCKASFKIHNQKVHHANEYKCDFFNYKGYPLCNRTFKTAKTLKEHITSIHEDLDCDYCGKLFLKAWPLKIHVFVQHEGHKDVRCDICEIFFINFSHFKTHMKELHPEDSISSIGNKKVNCQFCEKTFKSEVYLTLHNKNVHDVHEGNINPCNSCKKNFVGEIALKRHNEKIHDGQRDKLKCDICHAPFSESEKLKRHVKSKHKLNKCKLCEALFPKLQNLKNHIKVLHNKCEFCEKSFFKEEKLKRHIRFHHKSHKCDSCDKSFSNIIVLKKHKRIFHAAHKCDSCDKSFSNIRVLKKHKRIFHAAGKSKQEISDKEKNYQSCDLCEKSFSTSENLEAHLYTGHGKEYKCESCNQSFIYTKTLEKHKTKCEIHRICEICEKTFYNAENLKGHILTVHEERKDHKCDICDKSFSFAISLKKHINFIHESRKDYECQSCGKSFTTGQSLRNHFQIVHDGRKDYKCKYCDKSFSLKFTLKNHIKKIHENPKQIKKVNNNRKCDTCEESFLLASSLRKHIQLVHKDHLIKKQHACQICNKNFARASNLKKHIIQAHEEVKRQQNAHEGKEKQQQHDHYSCKESFSSAAEAREHILKFHKLKKADDAMSSANNDEAKKEVTKNTEHVHKVEKQRDSNEIILEDDFKNTDGAGENYCEKNDDPQIILDFINESDVKVKEKYDKSFDDIDDSISSASKNYYGNNKAIVTQDSDNFQEVISDKHSIKFHDFKQDSNDAEVNEKSNNIIQKVHQEAEKPHDPASCTQSFSSEAEAKEHSLKFHNPLKQVKNSCVKKQQIAKEAENVHEGEKQHDPDSCTQSFSSAAEAREHSLKFHKLKSNAEVRIKKGKIDKVTQEFHKEGEKQHHPDSCTTQSFSSAAEANDHSLKYHNLVKQGKNYEAKRQIAKEAENGHEGEKQHDPDSCTQLFSSAAEARENSLKFHNLAKQVKNYGTKRQIAKEAESVHEGEKQHDPDSCTQSFSSAAEAREHSLKFHNLRQTNKNIKTKASDKIRKISKVSKKANPNPNNSDDDINKIFKVNKNYIRKRKPVDFSLADLDADAELNDEVKFNLKTSNSGGKRDVPKRSCIKKASSINEYEET